MSQLTDNLAAAWEDRVKAIEHEAAAPAFLSPERVQEMFAAHSRALDCRRYWLTIGGAR